MKRDIPTAHPGEHLREFIEEYKLSEYRLAKDIHVPAPRINEIVHGRRAITADTALRLGRYFGTTALFWINLQTAYDLEQAEAAKSDTIEKEILPLKAAGAFVSE